MFGKEEFVDKKLSTILDDAVFFFEESKAIVYEISDNASETHEKSIRGSAFALLLFSCEVSVSPQILTLKH